MKKRILIHAYNVISLLSAILIAICLPIVVIMGEYWKATRPCLMMFLFSIVPIVCSSFIFFLSALPGKWKVKHIDVRRILESVLIICCCFSALDFFFEMRIEYIGFFGLLSADMEKTAHQMAVLPTCQSVWYTDFQKVPTFHACRRYHLR